MRRSAVDVWTRAIAATTAGLVGLALAGWISLHAPWPQGGIATSAAGSAGSGEPVATSPNPVTPERLRVQILETYPHDPGAFTQGLLLRDGALYESTGIYGRSSLRRTVPTTGEVPQSILLNPRYFAEGLADVGDRLIQLTWKEDVAFVYDMTSFQQVGQFPYTGEGWGLCYDGTRLVMSNGSSQLTFRDPHTFNPVGQVPVTADGRAMEQLNELECVGDRVYANVWMTDTILRIDPASGQVDGIIDASGLLTPEERRGADVLNGIAYDPSDGTFLITGKLWPKMFRVQFVKAD